MRTNILIIALFFSLRGLAQNSHHDYEGMFILSKCSCEMQDIFSAQKRNMSFVPSITFKCKHISPLADAPAYSYIPKGFSLFKRKKKRVSPNYPKTSTLIRL